MKASFANTAKDAADSSSSSPCAEAMNALFTSDLFLRFPARHLWLRRTGTDWRGKWGAWGPEHDWASSDEDLLHSPGNRKVIKIHFIRNAVSHDQDIASTFYLFFLLLFFFKSFWKIHHEDEFQRFSKVKWTFSFTLGFYWECFFFFSVFFKQVYGVFKQQES